MTVVLADSDLDLPYEMEAKEVRSLHSQMEEIYRTNRWLWEPYKIHLCGYNADNQVMNNLVSRLVYYFLCSARWKTERPMDSFNFEKSDTSLRNYLYPLFQTLDGTTDGQCFNFE